MENLDKCYKNFEISGDSMTLEEVFDFVFNKAELYKKFRDNNNPFGNNPPNPKDYEHETQSKYIQEVLSDAKCGEHVFIRIYIDNEKCVWYAENIATGKRVEFKKGLTPSSLDELC